MAVALRRGHAYDVPLLGMKGSPQRIARDSILMGTALSAPAIMLAVQAACTAMAARGDTRRAGPVLSGLGALMAPGYLAERLVQRRLRPSGWDSVESPLAVAGITLAAAMTVLGRAAA